MNASHEAVRVTRVSIPASRRVAAVAAAGALGGWAGAITPVLTSNRWASTLIALVALTAGISSLWSP